MLVGVADDDVSEEEPEELAEDVGVSDVGEADAVVGVFEEAGVVESTDDEGVESDEDVCVPEFPVAATEFALA